MKKWQILTIIGAGTMIVLVAFGSLIYRYVMVPRYVEPVVNKFNEYVHNDAVLATLYDEAVSLHDEGVLSDTTYTNFISTYNKRMRDDEEFAREILDSEEIEGKSNNESETISAKYASNQVGVTLIQVNDSNAGGKASTSYSSERTASRTKAEDRVEAEKILAEDENTPEPTEASDVETAYKKLQENMTASEFSTFISIMNKLDNGVLRSFMEEADKPGLKEYLHSKLSDKEYSEIVDLGYKYVYLFMEE